MNKTIMVIAFFAVVAIAVAGCNKQPVLVGNDSDIHGCKGSAGYSWCELKQKCLRTWEEPCEVVQNVSSNITEIAENESLSVDTVLRIAEMSDCEYKGNLTGRPLYENSTKTWWIPMELKGFSEGCTPVCEVSEETRSARIIWRCHGIT